MNPAGSYESKINQSDHQITVANSPIFMDGAISSLNESPIAFWNDIIASRMITIQNNSERKFTSSPKDGSGYPITMNLWLVYRDKEEKEIYNESIPLRDEIYPGKSIDQNINFPLPKIVSGTVEISLRCDDQNDICDIQRNMPWKIGFEKNYDIKSIQVAIIDTTFDEKDNIEIENFRKDFNATFGLSTQESEDILKALYSKEAIQEKILGGAIILGNPDKYAGDNSLMVKELKGLIKNSYSHLTQKVVFLPYNSTNVENKTHYLSECKKDPKWCRSTMAFANLDPYKNHFSHTFFEANPHLDFLIIIPTLSVN